MMTVMIARIIKRGMEKMYVIRSRKNMCACAQAHQV